MLAGTLPAISTPNVTIENYLATPERRHFAQEYPEQMFEGPLARNDLQMMLSYERQRPFDHTYGVRSIDDKRVIGDTVFDINKGYSFQIL